MFGLDFPKALPSFFKDSGPCSGLFARDTWIYVSALLIKLWVEPNFNGLELGPSIGWALINLQA